MKIPEQFNKEEYKKIFKDMLDTKEIKKSNETFKIKQFLKKAENSILIAKHHKEYEPKKDDAEKIYWDIWAITISYYSMLYATKAAILSKGYEVKTHDAAQIALGHLLVPDKILKEDLELLNQSHKIVEDEYVKYFSDAKTESYNARYKAFNTYTKRQLEDIYTNATKLIGKITLMLQE